MGVLILFFLLSIVFSFLCSIWEAVILSVTPAYINRKIHDGSSVGKSLANYKKDIDKPLSAILTLNTLAHTVGAIMVGSQAGKIFGSNYIDLGFTTFSYESIIAALMTLAILIFSEIIPKTIGANMWEKLTPFTVKSLNILLLVLSPFVWISQLITKSLKKDKMKSVFSKADFAAMARAGLESGALVESESMIIHNLLRLENLTARDIMTPRAVMFIAPAEQQLFDFYQKRKPIHFSRIPVYRNQPDHIIGVVLKDELLENIADGNHTLKLEDVKRDIVFIRDNTNLPDLMDLLVTKQVHLAILNDEFGSVVGLVTMEDLFETLLGLEITDETDKIEDLQRFARTKWEERIKKYGLENN